ncbi:unnamed protein product [Lactuca saligna]|uniref:Replication protein A subunit n=1 Tax=Lactuca saligna TaxID=75948 RepID=A0AA35ZTR2_LACSI|nr:unnamed protein product [Lactuca saligna]
MTNKQKHDHMERELSNILDITPNHNKKWTVIIQVLECGNTKQSKTKSNYRRLIFIDTQGTKVSALIFSSYLEFYKNTFQAYKCYRISNAKLIPTEPRYRLSSYEHSWSLTKHTLVEPQPELSPPPLPCLFTFTPFSQMFKYADAGNNQNVRGVVIKCFPSQQIDQGAKTSSKRDVIIVNEEKKLLILTLWDSLNDNEGKAIEELTQNGPMIFAIRVKVTTFYGLSLSITNGSSILINPPVKADLQLDNWFQQNNNEIKELLRKESYKDTDILLPHPEEEDIIPMAVAVTRMENMLVGPSHVLSRATINIDDGSGSICATISTPDIEKFIQFNPNSLREAEENGEEVHVKIAASIKSLSIVAFVRSYQTYHQQKPTKRFVIVKAYNPQQQNTHNQQQIETSNPPDPQSSTKTPSSMQTQKRSQHQIERSKGIETSTAAPIRPSKKMK